MHSPRFSRQVRNEYKETLNARDERADPPWLHVDPVSPVLWMKIVNIKSIQNKQSRPRGKRSYRKMSCNFAVMIHSGWWKLLHLHVWVHGAGWASDTVVELITRKSEPKWSVTSLSSSHPTIHELFCGWNPFWKTHSICLERNNGVYYATINTSGSSRIKLLSHDIITCMFKLSCYHFKKQIFFYFGDFTKWQ